MRQSVIIGADFAAKFCILFMLSKINIIFLNLLLFLCIKRFLFYKQLCCMSVDRVELLKHKQIRTAIPSDLQSDTLPFKLCAWLLKSIKHLNTCYSICFYMILNKLFFYDIFIE